MDGWDDLRFILAVGRAGGLSPAARVLGVNHTTVSRRIAAFEARLGARLFERLPSGFEPTAAGRQAIESAERVERELFGLARQIEASDAGLSGPLNITAPQMIIQVQLAEIVSRFCAANPGIDVSLVAANEILNLHRREADIAIRVSNTPEASLFGRVAARQNRCFYASQAYLRAMDPVFRARRHEAPVAAVCFTWSGDGPPPEVQERFPNARVSVRSDDMYAVHAAVQQGMGVGRLPCFLGDADPGLGRVPGFAPTPYLDIWVLTHPDLKRVEKVRRFMAFAAEAFAERAALYLGTS